MSHERTQSLSASPPLFENGFLDFFSRVHPVIPALIFVPVVAAGIWLGVDGGYGALATIGIGLVVFAGWGLGLHGALGRLELYGVMVLIWIVMLAWPVWWLGRYRYGPLEWLWRCLNYSRWFSWRL